eukprot:2238130-Pleurochrysis_carterae.AAC.1
MWIELWKGYLRGVIPVRMLANTREKAPEASTYGLRLTGETYRRLLSNSCPKDMPATLPEEFRSRNRRELKEAAQRCVAAEGGGTSG